MSYQYTKELYDRLYPQGKEPYVKAGKPLGYIPPETLNTSEDKRPTPKIDQIAMGLPKEKEQQKQEKK